MALIMAISISPSAPCYLDLMKPLRATLYRLIYTLALCPSIAQDFRVYDARLPLYNSSGIPLLPLSDSSFGGLARSLFHMLLA